MTNNPARHLAGRVKLHTMENYMKIHSFKWWLMAGALMIVSLAGCSGGGGGGSTTPAQPTPTGKTVITGTASAGIIYPGTVNVYAVDASGVKGALIGSATTSIDGKYSVPLAAYSGAIDVEVSGTYTDETTGNTVSIAATKPLHALVDAVNETTNNNRAVSVTPLTELAWRKASSNGTAATTPAAITSANKLVDDLFKISDIVGIEPVRPNNASMANASQESKAYTLALAVLSKMASTAAGASDSDKLDTALSSMKAEIDSAETSGSMSSTNSAFATALSMTSLSVDFPEAAAQLSGVGKKSQKITLSTSGTLPAGIKIYTIDGTIALPVDNAGNLKVSFRVESNGKTLSDVLLLTGVASGMGAMDPLANYLAPQKQLQFSAVFSPSGTGIGIGDFATLTYEVAPGATVTAADFSPVAGSVTAKDANGTVISGMTITFK
jgi:hypothetical protein